MKMKGLGRDMSKGLRKSAQKQMGEFAPKSAMPKLAAPKPFAAGGKVSSFGAEFAKQRASGAKEFTFGGKKFTTRLKEETTADFNKKFAAKAEKARPEIEEISASEDNNKYQTTDQRADAVASINAGLDKEERERGDYYSVKDREDDKHYTGPRYRTDKPAYLKKGGAVKPKKGKC